MSFSKEGEYGVPKLLPLQNMSYSSCQFILLPIILKVELITTNDCLEGIDPESSLTCI